MSTGSGSTSRPAVRAPSIAGADTYSPSIVTSPSSSATSAFPFPRQNDVQALRRGPLRRGSTASTTSVASNPLVETHPNAISTLVQPPIIRTGLAGRGTDSSFKPPTQKDIPPVTLTNIPHVDPKTFQPYLSQVGSLYDAFQRAKSEVENDDTALFHRDKKDKTDDDWEAVLSKKLQRPANARSDSVTSFLPSPSESSAPTPTRRRSSQTRRQAVTPLSTVPAVYGEEDFHLENPRTFDIVSEHSEIVKDPTAAPSRRKSLATNAILQEKLSWYMDTVEVHLISSISTASKSFFSALGSLRELHNEAEESVVRIQHLRKDLAKLDKTMAVDGLKIVRLKQRRDNIRKLAEAILQLEDIVDAVKECESLVDNGRYDTAIENLEDIERLIAGAEPKTLLKSRPQPQYRPIDLRRLKALENALNDLGQLRSQAGRGYESKFHNCLLNDMRNHVKNTDPKATLQRWGVSFNRPKPGQRRAPSAFPSYMNMSADFRIELEQAMQGLARAKYTTPAVTTFRALMLKEMKSVIRRQLPSSNDDDAVSTISASTHGGRRTGAEKSQLLARNIRAMDDQDWYDMLSSIYTNVSEYLRRLSVQVKILLDVTSTMDQSTESVKSPPAASQAHMRAPSVSRSRARSIQAEMQQALDMSSLLGEAVDTVQSQVMRVIKVRSQATYEMPPEAFIRFITLNRLFADECEAITGQSGVALKSVLDAQIREYISVYRGRQIQQLVETMDSDKWEAKDFGPSEADVLSRVIEGSTSDAPLWLEPTQIWQQLETPAPTNGEESAKVRLATVDEQKYILPASPIALLRTIESIQTVVVGIPSMSPDLASTLLDSLRQFNSRTSQLILGAGATRTANLKNITTKHLALSSQGLAFHIALIPYVREFFRRYSAPLQEFDKVKRSFQEHQQSIHEKLVDIMSNRASMHVRTLKTQDWSEGEVSPYMETLTKETATLQKVLSKHLPAEVVMGIMIPVFGSYRKQLEEAFSAVKARSDKEKERMVADARYFAARMGKLEGSGDLGDKILELVEAKQVDAEEEKKEDEK